MSNKLCTLYNSAKVHTLVENRLQFNTDDIELNLFETKEKAFDFQLEFNDIALISMYEGKKIMKLNSSESFDLMPRESLILDRYTTMHIDFPEAEMDHPTRCLALIISKDEISETLDLLNEKVHRYNLQPWEVNLSNVKFENDAQLSLSIRKIIDIASSQHPYQKALSKLATQELIISLMQTQAKSVLLMNTQQHLNQHPMAYAIQFIRDNIQENIDLEVVAQKAYMSKSSFFRHFKSETGFTPNDFILKEKISRAKQLLQNFNQSVTDVAFTLSFTSVSHFIQLFKKITGQTPNKFRQDLLKSDGRN